MKRNKSNFSEGDLVEVTAQDGPRQWTLCGKTIGSRALTECLTFYDDIDTFSEPHHTCLLGKVALVTKVILNKLDQPLIYELRFSEDTYYCKAFLAHKYLRKI